MFWLLIVTFFVACRTAEFQESMDLESDTHPSYMPTDLLLDIGFRLDEQALRNLMQVSKDYAAFAEYLAVHGHTPLSKWSMRLLVNYMRRNPFPSIHSANIMTCMICHRAVPPPFVPLKDRPCPLQELESRKYFDLMALSWLPTPEILLPPFMHAHIYKAQCFWSSGLQFFWLPDKDFTLDAFETEMEQYPEDTFTSMMLAITSQPAFRHLLTPFFMANYIIPSLRGINVRLSTANLSFLRRLSQTTHCFDPIIGVINQMARSLQANNTVTSQLMMLCNRFEDDRVKQTLPMGSLYYRIQLEAYLNACYENPRMTLLISSLCGFNVRLVAEKLQGGLAFGSFGVLDDHLRRYLTGTWTDTQIRLTPENILNAVAGVYEQVALEAGMMLPTGALLPKDEEENMIISNS